MTKTDKETYYIVTDGWGWRERVSETRLPKVKEEFARLRCLTQKAGMPQRMVDRFNIQIVKDED